MQSDDRAEYEASKVLKIFTKVLADRARAQELLEHIRYRTGLLIERRAGIFAFAHLTFQEYLAACAVHEGNYRDIDAEQLAHEHADGRWNEVIALYCGVAPTRDARRMLERLIEQEDTEELAGVLAEAYLSSGAEVRQDQKLRRRVIERIAIAPSSFPAQLERFPEQEIASIANSFVGKTKSAKFLSQSHAWLMAHPNFIDETALVRRLSRWQKMFPTETSELIHLLHRFGSNDALAKMSTNPELHNAPGPTLRSGSEQYGSLAEIALIGLSLRELDTPQHIFSDALLQIFRSLVVTALGRDVTWSIRHFLRIRMWKVTSTVKLEVRKELVSLSRQLARQLKDEQPHPFAEDAIDSLNSWANSLERTLTEDAERRSTSKSKSKKTTKRATKKTAKRR